jgi:hypothetical protein
MSVFLNIARLLDDGGSRRPIWTFCLDERRHHNIVLLAAGSGITPMIAMLRYIDDLCLDTRATLLYCVRTNRDIMFERTRAVAITTENTSTTSLSRRVRSGRSAQAYRPGIRQAVNNLQRRIFVCGLLRSWMPAAAYLLIGGEANESAGEALARRPRPDVCRPRQAQWSVCPLRQRCTIRSGQPGKRPRKME